MKLFFNKFVVVSLILAAQAHAVSEEIIKVDGSSTVFPITEAVAEEFGVANKGIKVTVGVSGTGGGFKKFCHGEIHINDASRPIKDIEKAECAKNKIQYLALPVAFDGLSVIVNPQNTWVDHLTVEELNKIWMPESKITKWSELRAGWPDRKIILYGPGTDSGTFDYFTEVINGKAQASRSEFTKSEDDNVLVQGIAGNKDALGYFGYAYYKENKKAVRAVAIQDKGGKPVMPTEKTIADGSYKPLSRKIYIYVNVSTAKKPEVRNFVEFYLKNVAALLNDVGYIPLSDGNYKTALQDFSKSIK